MPEIVELGVEEHKEREEEIKTREETDFEIISSKIDEISYPQLQEAVVLMLSQQSSLSEDLDPRIKAQIDYWKGEEFLSESSEENKEAKIKDTCDFFYEYFKFEPFCLEVVHLRGNGPLAANLSRKLDGRQVEEVKEAMFLYCQYLAALSSKPKEVQVIFLESFPPQSPDDIACLGGTKTRIDDNLKQLVVLEEDKFALEAYRKTISRIVEDLKPYVSEGNHVHLLPYLSYVLGSEGRDVIERRDRFLVTPQFDIPSDQLFEKIRSYERLFKDFLKRDEDFLRKIMDVAEEDMKLMEEICDKNNCSAHSLVMGESDSKDIKDVIVGKFGVKSIGDLVEEDPEDEEKYCWSREKIVQIATKKSMPKFFGGAEVAQESDLPLNQDAIVAISMKSGLFSKDTFGNLIALLKSENIEEIMVGVEALWVLAEKMACNSKIQVVRVVNDFGGGGEFCSYLEEKLSTKKPHHFYKVQRVKENFDVYITDENVQKYLLSLDGENPQQDQISLRTLLDIGVTTEELAEYCQTVPVLVLESEIRVGRTLSLMKKRSDFIEVAMQPDQTSLRASLPLRTLLDIGVTTEQLTQYCQNIPVSVLESEIRVGRTSSLMNKRSDFVEVAVQLDQEHKRCLFQTVSQKKLQETLDFLLSQEDSEERTQTIVSLLSSFPANLSQDIVGYFLERKDLFLASEGLMRALDEEDIKLLAGKFYSAGEENLVRIVESGELDSEEAKNIQFLAKLGLKLRDIDKRAKNNLHVKYFVNTTAAHVAVERGDLEMFRFLKECGSTLDGKDRLKKRPIHYAIKSGNKKIFDYILNSDVRNKRHNASLLGEVCRDYVRRPISAVATTPVVFVSLLSNFPQSFSPGFHLYEGGKIPFSERRGSFLSYVKFSEDLLLSFFNAYDTSVTYTAAQYGRVDMLKALLERGVATPTTPTGQLMNSEITQTLKAGRRAEEISKSVVKIIKQGLKVRMAERQKAAAEQQSEDGEEITEEYLKILETTLKIAILQRYQFDAKAIKMGFGLEDRTSTQKASGSFRVSDKIRDFGNQLGEAIRSGDPEKVKTAYEAVGLQIDVAEENVAIEKGQEEMKGGVTVSQLKEQEKQKDAEEPSTKLAKPLAKPAVPVPTIPVR